MDGHVFACDVVACLFWQTKKGEHAMRVLVAD
jgi:hypothetical protein